jgi:type IV secretion system protein VirB10
MEHEQYDEDGVITEETIAGDRNIPKVARNNNIGKVVGSFVFILVVLLALSAVIYDAMRKNQPREVAKTEEIIFKAPQVKGEPYIIEQAATPPPEVLSAAPPPQTLEIDRFQLLLQAEALRIAQEQQRALQERLKSPQLVYDQSKQADITQQKHAAINNAMNGGAQLLSGDNANLNENLAFASSQQNTDVETSSATQLQNLDTLIAQGKMISGILETAVQSDLPGMVRAIISEDVYSFKGSNLLIPKGTRLVGQYRSSIKQGQSRIFIIWNRVIRPDGASININSFGSDTLGRSGLEGVVDSHFMERFSASILLSTIDGALSALANSIDKDGSEISLNGSKDFSRSSEIALENSIGIAPTININQGTRIKVFVGKDLDFSAVGPVLVR